MRNMELPGRSPVHAPSGMVATSSSLASLTGINMLQRGGNAMDAAIAACAVQCVVEPASTGVGGDCFCLYSPSGSREIIAFNGSGTAPASATADWYAMHQIKNIERQSPHSVVIPGAVDAWCQLNKDHGRLPLDELLGPAIRYAENGYPIASRVALDLLAQKSVVMGDENLRRVFMPTGSLPDVGEMHHQPELAESLRKIARDGRDAFYSGEIADDIVTYLQSKGGLHTLADFQGYSGEYVVPISTKFRNFEIFECPPNGQGVIALMLMNIMNLMDPGHMRLNSIEHYHLEIEAGKLAYRDRDLYISDPAYNEVPVKSLLSPEYAKELLTQINPTKANTELPLINGSAHPDTVYISVVDEERNCCSFINTLFEGFGSGLMSPKSGIVLTNRAQGFVLDPMHPNCIGPKKRPLHTIIPGMVCKDGKVVMPFGVMGGQYQAFGHMNFLTRFIDYKLDIQEAQDSPRLFPDPENGTVEVESGIPGDVIEGLKSLGHKVVQATKPIGGSQAIWVDWEAGILTGGSESRKDGCAIGY